VRRGKIQMLTILNKELRSYFYSATAYIFMGIFLFISGLFFALINVLQRNPNFASVLGNDMVFVFLLITPVLTMKTLAEESRNKTDQLLLTSPQSVTAIVVGKYFAAIVLFGITLLITLLFPLMISFFGKLALSETLSNYIGFFLMGSCFIAVGVFISSLTDNQVVAGVGTLGVLISLWIMDFIISGLPISLISGVIFALILVFLISGLVFFSTRNMVVALATFLAGILTILGVHLKDKLLFEGFVTRTFGWFSLIERYENFTLGIISLNSIVYFISFSFVFVYLTIRIIEKRRWS
jgi:ABC-2 type transport system permease protein